MANDDERRVQVDSVLLHNTIVRQKLLMELDITAVVIGYGVQKEVAREIAARVVDEVFNGV